MPKRAIIVHGWDGTPEEGWFPWLQRKLERRGFAVTVPVMPDTGTPKPDLWVPHLASVVGVPDHETFLIGHSMGCQTILRYLAGLSGSAQIGGAILVAGFTELSDLSKKEEDVWAPWRKQPLDLAKARSHSKHFSAIFSDNDPWVSLVNERTFRYELGSSSIVLHDRKHFSGEDGIRELPEALSAVLDMARKQ